VPTVSKSGNLTLLEPSGPVQACNGIALPIFSLQYIIITKKHFSISTNPAIFQLRRIRILVKSITTRPMYSNGGVTYGNTLRSYRLDCNGLQYNPLTKSTFVQSNTSLFNQLNCPHMYATCFDRYLRPFSGMLTQVHLQQDTIEIQGPPFTFTVLKVLHISQYIYIYIYIYIYCKK